MAHKRIMEAEAVRLIKHLTGIEEEHDVNFEICRNFVLSNLFYHNFLDPLPQTIKNRCDGICTKWDIHLRTKRASKMKGLLNRYWKDPVFTEQKHEQFDIQTRILAVLCHLSESVDPSDDVIVSSESSSTASSPSASKIVDWKAYLAEGETVFKYNSDEDSELSEWSVTSAESIESDNENEFEGLKGKESSRSSKNIKTDGLDDAKHWLEQHIQDQYWECRDKDRKYEDGTFIRRHEDLCWNAGIPRPSISVVTEYQAIREILWMLREPVDAESLLFRKSSKDGNYFPNKYLSLPSLANSSFTTALEKYCHMLDDIYILRHFIRDQNEERPFTYEAFSGTITEILQNFSRDLLTIETEITKQEDIFTMLDLDPKLNRWSRILRFLASLYSKAVNVDSSTENWYKAVKLIAVLASAVSQTYKQDEFEISVECLLRTLRPYIRIMNTWLCDGRLEDWRKEFVFRQNPRKAIKDQNYWTETFTEMPYVDRLKGEGLPILDFFPFQKTLTVGKSVQILSILEEDGYKRSEQRLYPKIELYSEVIDSVKSNLTVKDAFQERRHRHPLEEEEDQDQDHNQEEQRFDNEEDVDPYLLLAFSSIHNDVEPDNNGNNENKDDDDDGFILRNYEMDVVRPFVSLIYESLDPIVDRCYRTSCSLLLDLFKTTLDLEQHLASVRRVFLMEAGDLLAEFYSEIFTRMDARDVKLDSSSLTLFLHDCLHRRYSKAEAERFYIVLQRTHSPDVLDWFFLKYKVTWPLNIVINDRHLELYADVFRFLLKVKRALWTLKWIRAKDLENRQLDEYVRHRILLLRSWLFHFVGNVHSYFMTRVLHSTEVELKDNLKESKDLNDVIKIHSDYISRIVDRCFLHSSASVLRNAVLKVLSLCSSLKELLSSSSFDDYRVLIQKIDMLEEVYSRSHQFLATTLKSMTQKRNVPHLEGLAVALIYSSPQKI